jgi:hypothetical protein
MGYIPMIISKTWMAHIDAAASQVQLCHQPGQSSSNRMHIPAADVMITKFKIASRWHIDSTARKS